MYGPKKMIGVPMVGHYDKCICRMSQCVAFLQFMVDMVHSGRGGALGSPPPPRVSWGYLLLRFGVPP